MTPIKKFIEVAPPLDATNREAAEKIAYLHTHSGEFHLRSIRRLQAVLLPMETDG